MSKFINPLTDYGWKAIFGRETSKPVLIGILNALLEGEKVIEDLVFLDKEQQPEMSGGRMYVYDIYCRTNTGEHIIIEMQRESQVYFKDRALFYTAAAIVNQGRPGDWKYQFDAVYGVFFLDFRLSDSHGEVVTDVIMADRKTGEMFNDKLRQIFISLPNFTLQEDECKTQSERWIYVLKNMETFDHLPFTEDIPVMRELEKIIAVTSMDPEQHGLYQASLKAYRDNYAVLSYKVEEGIAIGEARSEAKVKAAEERADKAEAVAKAKAEAQREQDKLATARTLKASGVSTEIIMHATGLLREAIEQL